MSIAARALETGATSSKSSFSGTALSRTGTTCKHREHVNGGNHTPGNLQRLSLQDARMLLSSLA